jgi:hypothetical protein
MNLSASSYFFSFFLLFIGYHDEFYLLTAGGGLSSYKCIVELALYTMKMKLGKSDFFTRPLEKEPEIRPCFSILVFCSICLLFIRKKNFFFF